MDRFVDVNHLARILSVKPATIYGWVHEGYVPHLKIGRLVRFSLKDIEQWLREKRRKGRTSRLPEVEPASQESKRSRGLDNE